MQTGIIRDRAGDIHRAAEKVRAGADQELARLASQAEVADTGHLTEYMAEVERREVGKLRQPRHVPLVRRCYRNGFLDSLQRPHPPRQRRWPHVGFLPAQRIERHVEQVETDRLDFEIIALALPQPRAEQVAQHHGGSRQQPVRGKPRVAVPVDMIRRKLVAKAQGQRAVANASGKADTVGRVGRNEHGMAGRADHLPPRRIVLGEHAGQRQHHGGAILPLDIAAGIGHRARLEQADLQGRAFEQGFAGDWQGENPLA